MRIGDSRALEGPGVIPAQDHRRDLNGVDARALQVCSRIVDRDDDGIYREDEELRGDRIGINVWETLPDRRPMCAWRECWIAIACGADGAVTIGGDAATTPGGQSFGLEPPGAWQPPTTTPGGGSSFGIEPAPGLGGGGGYSGGSGGGSAAGAVGEGGGYEGGARYAPTPRPDYLSEQWDY